MNLFVLGWSVITLSNGFIIELIKLMGLKLVVREEGCSLVGRGK